MNKQKTTCVQTADVIANYHGKIVLVERLKFPFGLALPGGHIDAGEGSREAAIREFHEETGLTLHDVRFVTCRHGKFRDPRYGMSSTSVYAGVASGTIKNEKGFTRVVLLSKSQLQKLKKEDFAFDHHDILRKFLEQ